MVKNIIQSLDTVRFDRAHFAKIGTTSYDYEVVYYVTNPDYTLYMDRQQTINLAIIDEFIRLNIQFANPNQAIIVNNTYQEQPSETSHT